MGIVGTILYYLFNGKRPEGKMAFTVTPDADAGAVSGSRYMLGPSASLYRGSQIIALVTGLTRTLGAGFYVTYESPNVPQGILAMKAFMSVNGAASAPHVHLQLARGSVYPANTATV